MKHDEISYLENGEKFTVTCDEMLKYHGEGYPGGVVHGLKVMQRAWPFLDGDRLPERREIRCVTAFGGPGGRDAIEFVTRGLTEGRYIIDKTQGEGVEESPGGRYYFRFEYRDKAVEITIRPGHVRPEFIQLSRKQGRTPEEEVELAKMKREMASRLIVTPTEELYDVKVVAA